MESTSDSLHVKESSGNENEQLQQVTDPKSAPPSVISPPSVAPTRTRKPKRLPMPLWEPKKRKAVIDSGEILKKDLRRELTVNYAPSGGGQHTEEKENILVQSKGLSFAPRDAGAASALHRHPVEKKKILQPTGLSFATRDAGAVTISALATAFGNLRIASPHDGTTDGEKPRPTEPVATAAQPGVKSSTASASTTEVATVQCGFMHGGDRQWQQWRPCRHSHVRPHEPITVTSLLNAAGVRAMEEEDGHFEEYDNVNVPPYWASKWAIPEMLVWRYTCGGQVTNHILKEAICPRHDSHQQHLTWTEEELAAERFRTNGLYRLICEMGAMRIEDLYREHVKKTKEHPFDNFDQFHLFVAERAHIFRMDQSYRVFNENLLVTLAVMRYAHALYHGKKVEQVPDLFKEKGGLFVHAFLAFMRVENLSFDTFFQHFPFLFKFDKEWTLNLDKARLIPSAFERSCVPERVTTSSYVDRSQIFSGVGRVVEHYQKRDTIRVESEDCLRKGLPYYIDVKKSIMEDPKKFKKLTRVAFTAIRKFNDGKHHCEGTSIQLEPEEKPKVKNDGTIPDFWSFEEETGNSTAIAENNDKKESAKKEEEVDPMFADDTGNADIIRMILEKRRRMAEKEHIRQPRMLKLAEKLMKLSKLWEEVEELFINYIAFLGYVQERPFVFELFEAFGTALIVPRSAETRNAMQDYIVSLSGSKGRSFTLAEAKEMCEAKNATLAAKDQFSFEDFVPKCIRLVTNADGTVTNIEPQFYWSWEYQLMLKRDPTGA